LLETSGKLSSAPARVVRMNASFVLAAEALMSSSSGDSRPEGNAHAIRGGAVAIL
jgi:hypothetical protein